MLGSIRRLAFPALALAGSVLLIVAEFLRLYEIKVITVTVATGTVGSHHGYALLVVGLAAAALTIVGGRSQPARLALVLLGVVAVAVALIVDMPVVDDTGLYGRDYEQAQAQAGPGFYVETLGAVLLLIGAVGMAVFGARGVPANREQRPDRGPEREPMSPATP